MKNQTRNASPELPIPQRIVVGLGIAAVASLLLFISPKTVPNALACSIDASGQVTPTGHAAGVLHHGADMFYLESEPGHFTFTDAKQPGSHRMPAAKYDKMERLYEILESQNGAEVQLDLCGKSIVKLTAHGRTLFSETVKDKRDDDAAAAERFTTAKFFAIVLWTLFVVSLLYFWRDTRNKKKRAL